MKQTTTALLAISLAFPCVHGAQSLMQVSGCEPGRLSAMPDNAFSKIEWFFSARIEKIRATPNMKVPEGAPCRYLSEKGSDEADGLTPATAWRTTKRLGEEQLEPGSFVLFERGGLFRGGVKTYPGVTYTAYGTGPKPRVYSSPEDGADPAKWEETGVANVWRYKIGEKDVGTLVFDGGRQHAIKIIPIYNDDGTFTQQYGKRPFNNGYADLAEDLHFWHDYSANTRFKPHAKGTGYLYLYSKENPGRRFKSIEFCVKRNGFGAKNGVTIDNICVMYVGAHGIGGGTVKDFKVTNCEIGWIGGSIQCESFYGAKRPTRYGNGVEIYGGCDGYTIDNCYVHDVYDAGITHQYDMRSWKGGDPILMKNVKYTRNVIERCNYSIEYFLHCISDPVKNPSRMENILFEKNLMRDSAKGFCEQRPDRTQGAHIKCWRYWGGNSHNNRATGFVIRDNVMCMGGNMLVEISSSIMNPDGSDSMPEMTGNVFVGEAGQRFGVLNQGKAVELKYNESLPGLLGARYADNVFATRGAGK